MTEQEYYPLARVENCNNNTISKEVLIVNLKAFFPIDGCGIVYEESCQDDTSGERTAFLVTNPEQEKLYCKNFHCKHFKPIEVDGDIQVKNAST